MYIHIYNAFVNKYLWCCYCCQSGLDGESVHVEELVMQIFSANSIDEDELVSGDSRLDARENAFHDLPIVPPFYSGGSWKGWHCKQQASFYIIRCC